MVFVFWIFPCVLINILAVGILSTARNRALFNYLSVIQLPSQVLTKACVYCGYEKGLVQARQLCDKVGRERDIIKAVNPYIHPEVQKGYTLTPC